MSCSNKNFDLELYFVLFLALPDGSYRGKSSRI